MAAIVLSEPEGPYNCTLDTGVMKVELKEVFNGVRFVSESGETLSVCMRDSGFEVRYFLDTGDDGFDNGWMAFKNGAVSPLGKRD